MTIGCDVTFFLPLLQGGPRLTFKTQGSAKPPPWVWGTKKGRSSEGAKESFPNVEPQKLRRI